MKFSIRTLTYCFSIFFFIILDQAFCLNINEIKILASDGAGYDFFGCSVAVSGSYAIVGAYGDDDTGSLSGSAYIFRRVGDNWIQQVKLLPSDGAVDDRFGQSVSISGDYAIVGAPLDDDTGSNSGSAYIFKREDDSWVQQTKLLANDGAAEDYLGYSVSISGDYALVGASWNDDRGSDSGSAYIFKREGDSWVQQTKLLANDGSTDHHFGFSVALSGDCALVGSHLDYNNNRSGSAYIFKREGESWIQEHKLLPSDGEHSDYFGISVAISGDYAAIGADGNDDYGSWSGSAYIFKREDDIWVQQTKLLANDGAAGDYFGCSVAISGNYAVVGAYGDDDTGSSSGSAYIFKREGDNWIQNTKMLAIDGTVNTNFGFSGAILDGHAVIGAPGDSGESGSAYIEKIETIQINISNVGGGAIGLEGTWRVDVYDAYGEPFDQYYSTTPSVAMFLDDGDYTAQIYFLFDDGIGIWEFWGEIGVNVTIGNDSVAFIRNMPWLGDISPWQPTLSQNDSTLSVNCTLTNELPTSIEVMFEGQLGGGDIISSNIVTLPGCSSTDVTFQFNDLPGTGAWPLIYWVKADPKAESNFIATDHSKIVDYLTVENESELKSEYVYMDYQDEEGNLWQIGFDIKDAEVEAWLYNPQEAFKNIKFYKNGVRVSPSAAELEVLLNRVAHQFNVYYPNIRIGDGFDIDTDFSGIFDINTDYGIWRQSCGFSWACGLALTDFDDYERKVIYKELIWDSITCRNHPYLNTEYRVPDSSAYTASELPLTIAAFIDDVWSQYSDISGVKVQEMNRMKKILSIAEKAEQDPDLASGIQSDCKQLGKVVSMLQTAGKIGDIATETIENILIMEFLASTGFGEQRLATLKEAYSFVADNIEGQIDPVLLVAINEVETELDSNMESLGNSILYSFLEAAASDLLDPNYVKQELINIAADSKLTKKLVSGVAKNLKLSNASVATAVMDGIKALTTVMDIGDDWRRIILSGMLSKTVCLYAQNDASWNSAAYPANGLVTYSVLLKHQIRDVYDLQSVFAFEYLSRGLALLDSSWMDVLHDAIDSTIEQASSPPYTYPINYASTAVLFGQQIGTAANSWIYSDSLDAANDMLMSIVDQAEMKNKVVNQWAAMMANGQRKAMPWIPLLLLGD